MSGSLNAFVTALASAVSYQNGELSCIEVASLMELCIKARGTFMKHDVEMLERNFAFRGGTEEAPVRQ